MAGITKELEEEIREAFSLFDKKGDGQIPSTELGTVVRSLGQNPTEEEVSNIVRNNIRKNAFTLQDLLGVMANFLRTKRDGPDEIKEAFRVFDREGQGFIGAGEMRHVLTNLGEKLTDQEVDALIQGVDVGPDGMLQYDELVKMMTSKNY